MTSPLSHLPRPRHLGELLVDLAIVVGSALYVHAASHYPSQGRQIPTLVGYLALGMGALHLLAHVVPRLWDVTHGSGGQRRSAPALPERPTARGESEGPGDPGAQDADGAAGEVGAGAGADGARAASAARATDAPDDAAPGAPGPAAVALDVSPGQPRQVLVAMAWVVALLGAVYVFGFVVAIPAFFLAYFAVLRAWRIAAISAVAMWAVTQFLFIDALGVPLPHGLV